MNYSGCFFASNYTVPTPYGDFKCSTFSNGFGRNDAMAQFPTPYGDFKCSTANKLLVLKAILEVSDPLRGFQMFNKFIIKYIDKLNSEFPTPYGDFKCSTYYAQ